MGWTGIDGDFENADEFFRDYYAKELAEATIIDFYISGGDTERYFEQKEAYTAYRRQDGSISAFVALIQHTSGDEWLIKDITEDEGPMTCGCPQRILRQLDAPRIGTFAAQWRKECGDIRSWPTVEDRISEIVANSINQERDNLADEIKAFLEDTCLDDEEKRESIVKAGIVFMSIFHQGSLPDATTVYSMDDFGECALAHDIAEEITSPFRDDFGNDDAWNSIVSDIERECRDVIMGESATCCATLPDGSEYVVYTRSCEEVLKEHGAYPEFGTEGPKS